MLSTLKSFGYPYLQPFVPVTKVNNNGIFVSPAWKREKRPDFLNTKKEKSQKHISMGWKFPDS